MKNAPDMRTEALQDIYKDTKFSPEMQSLVRQITEDSLSKDEPKKIDNDTILYMVDTRFLNPTKPLPEVRTWAKIGGRPSFQKEGIVLLNAKPKQGKSYALYAIFQTLIKGEVFDTLEPIDCPSRVIVFDTEMSEIDLQTRIRPLYQKIGSENAAKFQVCSLLSVPKTERLNVIEDIVRTYDPPIIAIDQVADLMDDFNASAEAVSVFEKLKVLMAKRTVFLVIHQNKAKDDTNSKGHAGTLAEQDATEVYSIKKEKGIFELSLRMSRFASSDDAEPFRFSLSDGEIVSAEEISKRNEETERKELRKELSYLFGAENELPSSTLVEKIIRAKGVSERTAKAKIKEALVMGIVSRKKAGRSAIYALKTP